MENLHGMRKTRRIVVVAVVFVKVVVVGVVVVAVVPQYCILAYDAHHPKCDVIVEILLLI